MFYLYTILNKLVQSVCELEIIRNNFITFYPTNHLNSILLLLRSFFSYFEPVHYRCVCNCISYVTWINNIPLAIYIIYRNVLKILLKSNVAEVEKTTIWVLWVCCIWVSVHEVLHMRRYMVDTFGIATQNVP